MNGMRFEVLREVMDGCRKVSFLLIYVLTRESDNGVFGGLVEDRIGLIIGRGWSYRYPYSFLSVQTGWFYSVSSLVTLKRRNTKKSIILG